MTRARVNPLHCDDLPRLFSANYRSLCPNGRGFALDRFRKNVVDINECEVFPATMICPNARCINLIGAFRCVCHRGYYYDSQARACKGNRTCMAISMVLFMDCSLKGQQYLSLKDFSQPTRMETGQLVERLCIRLWHEWAEVQIYKVRSNRTQSYQQLATDATFL